MPRFLHSTPSTYCWLLLFVVQAALYTTSFAQQGRSTGPSPELSSLHDSARVDYLNHLSYYYITKEQKDSALSCALSAYREAIALNYSHGVAVSLTHQAQIAKHFDDDFVRSEQLGKASLQWYKKTPDQSGIDTLYHHLAYTAFAQSRFGEALGYARQLHALARQKGSRLAMIDALGWIFSIYRQSGNYEQSFLYAQQAYELALQENSKIKIAAALYGLAQLYMLIEDYPHALDYFRQVLRMDDPKTRADRVIRDVDIWFKMEFTEVFSHLGLFDSAWHYYHQFRPPQDKAVYMRVYWVSAGECHYLQKNYAQALRHFELALPEHQKLNDRNEVMRTLLDLGKTHLALNQNAEAIRYARQGLALALQTHARQYIRDGYHVLSTVYDRLDRVDSANYYFRQYARAKEAVLNDQAKGRMAAFKYEQQIALVNKEKELQQVRLQKEAFVKKVLLSGFVLLALLAFIVVRNVTLKRRNEKQHLEHEIALQKMDGDRTRAEFRQQAIELQMQALRAQMNPHFIFNSLNSINHFILCNEKAQASDYLIKFSRLIRLILQHSSQPIIALESELEALRLYLELEALRFNHHFDYTLVVEEDLDVSALKVPPLIIQPYVENAIWHGLMNKEENGHLEIEVTQEGDWLWCKIIDDGVGRTRAAELKSKSASAYKSMGMKITADRIAMLHLEEEANNRVVVNDLVAADGSAAGTEVTLKLPVRYA